MNRSSYRAKENPDYLIEYMGETGIPGKLEGRFSRACSWKASELVHWIPSGWPLIKSRKLSWFVYY